MTFSSVKFLLCAAVLVILPVEAMTQWATLYEQGLEQLAQGQWNEAANSFRAALGRNSKPDLNAREYGLNYFEYLPYYQLGRALFFQLDFAGAMENFDRELSYGAIKKSPRYQDLLRLRETAKILQEHLGPLAEKSTGALLELLLESYRRGQGLTKSGRNIDSLLAQIRIDEETRQQLVQWFVRLSTGKPVPPPTSGPATPAQITTDSVSALRNAVVAAYLQGRYREALTLLNRLAQVAPGEPMLADWQQRVRFELSRLDQGAGEPLVKTDTVRIEHSAAPVISILEPRAAESRYRREQIRLLGLAHDDVGIATIEAVVNGEPLPTPLRPIRNTDGAFPFEITIPLKLGENQVFVTAYDLDREQHRSTPQLRRIIRQPPLYQTTSFWFLVGSGFLVLAGALIGNRLIKYRIAFVNRYNPYIAGLPIRNEEMFFGRKELLDRILRTLPNNSLMVFGPRRIGKTSLQCQLQRLLQERHDPDYHFVPVFIDLQGIAEEVFFAHLIEELREQLGQEIAKAIPAPADRRQYGHREFANDLRLAINLLQSQQPDHKKVRLVFLLDEVDELNRYSERTNQRLRAIFMKSFSENLVAVLTGSNIRKHWESESSPWYNFFEQIPMLALTSEEAMQLIHAPVKGFFKYEPEAANKIWEASQGKPFVIQRFCVRLVNQAIERRRRKIVAADVEAIRQEVLQDTA